MSEKTSIETLENPFVPMGHIIGPHGIMGCVKVAHYTEKLTTLLDYSTWWLSSNNKIDFWFEIDVKSYFIHADRIVVLLGDINNRTEAIKLKGAQIAIPKSQLPVLPENGDAGYYWVDLIGSQVVNIHNELLGQVVGLLETGANDVLRVKGADIDNKERLVPFIDRVVIQVDLKSKKILVDWGLDYC